MKGTILTASTRMAYCDLEEGFVEGDAVVVTDGATRLRARITYLQTGLKGKMAGHIEFLQAINRPPARGSRLEKEVAGTGPAGLQIDAGLDGTGTQVLLRINRLFKHALLAGKSTSGKTHLGLGIVEQLRTWRTPTLVVDPQNEWLGLEKTFPDAIVRAEDEATAMKGLRERKIVLLAMYGLGVEQQRELVGKVLGACYRKHEALDLKGKAAIPTLLVVDEADLFAGPRGACETCIDVLIDIAKRGIKLGLGLLLLTQRPNSLHVDVRSQLNSCALFRLDDPTSVNFLRGLGLTTYDLNAVSRLQTGECLMAGQIVDRPCQVKVRDILSPRVRSLDFEAALAESA